MSTTSQRTDNALKNDIASNEIRPSGSTMSGTSLGSTQRDIHPSSNLASSSTTNPSTLGGTNLKNNNTTAPGGVTGISGNPTSGASTLKSENVTQTDRPLAREGDRSNVKVISGETERPVLVQSQLASNSTHGAGSQTSNLDKVVTDLGAAHNAHSGWLEGESLKISEWGNNEIKRILEQTKGVQERLVNEAQAKQRKLEDNHKLELGRLVEDLDRKKSRDLKELEDSLQRQLQAALDTTKNDINNIESEMNKRKMDLLKQMQLQTAKDVDRLSSLQVQAKLVPSTTRTIIETNTETGLIRAVAGGGNITTGSAESQSLGGPSVRAVPLEGKVSQDKQPLINDANKGDHIMGAMTQMNTTSGPHGTARPLGASSGTSSGLLPTEQAAEKAALGREALKDQDLPNEKGIGYTGTGSTTTEKPIHMGEKQWTTPADRGSNITATSVAAPTTAATTAGPSTAVNTENPKRVDAAYGRDLKSGENTDLNKTDEAGVKHEGIMSKIKHAITGEPRTATTVTEPVGMSHVHTQAPRNQPF